MQEDGGATHHFNTPVLQLEILGSTHTCAGLHPGQLLLISAAFYHTGPRHAGPRGQPAQTALPGASKAALPLSWEVACLAAGA
eukprot:1150619-Pelagomonas_calceolata.AAC.6